MKNVNIQNLSFQDFEDPAILADPYPWYQALRSEAPIHKEPSGQAWMMTRHDDIVEVLRDARFSAVRSAVVSTPLARQMLFMDPPDHTDVRRLFVRAFSPHHLTPLRNEIENMANTLLFEALKRGKTVDFISDFADLFPVMVIAKVLGFPVSDWKRLQQWSHLLARMIGGLTMSPAEAKNLEMCIVDFSAYIVAKLAERRANPRDDTLSRFVNLPESQASGEKVVQDEELIMNIILLFAAGHSTMTHLLGNGLLALSKHKHQWKLLVDDPDAIPGAVGELLRYDAPVQATERVALEDVDIGGECIKKGHIVRLFLGSANHDEKYFTDPAVFDVRRPASRAAYFGHGVHACLGGILARMEAEIVFRALAENFPNFSIEPLPLNRLRSLTVRGLTSLPVHLV